MVAMQFPISNVAATQFANGFYKSLATNASLEKAMTWARVRMSHASEMEWGIPVLFTRYPSGRLFNLRGAADPDTLPPPARQPAREEVSAPIESAQELARKELSKLFHGSFGSRD